MSQNSPRVHRRDTPGWAQKGARQPCTGRTAWDPERTGEMVSKREYRISLTLRLCQLEETPLFYASSRKKNKLPINVAR